MLHTLTQRCAVPNARICCLLSSKKPCKVFARRLMRPASDTHNARDVSRKAVKELTEVSNYACLILQGYGKAALSGKPKSNVAGDPSPKPKSVVPRLTAAVGQRKQKVIISVAVMPDGEVVLVCEDGPDAIEVDSDESLQVPASDIGKDSFLGGVLDAVSHIGGGRPMVHRSFVEAFDSILDNKAAGGKGLQEAITSAANGTTTRITCVGHGLGGAVATVAAYWCAKSAFPRAKVSCITFGAPRVGNPAFAAEFDSMLAKSGGDNLRVIHELDPFPAVPPEASQFKHAGSPLLLVQPGLPNASRLVDRAAGKAPYEALPEDRTVPDDSDFVLGDHYLEVYQTALWATLGIKKTLKAPAEGSPEQLDAVRLYSELQELGSNAPVKLMSVEQLQDCFLYSQVAFLAYEDQFAALDKKFDTWRPWMKEDLWGQVVHAQILHASEKLNNIANTDTEAIVMIRDLGGGKAEAIVGFRGTETGNMSSMISDVMTDLTGSMIRLDAENVVKSFGVTDVDNGVRVHKGFAYSFEDLINPGLKKRTGWSRPQKIQGGKRVPGQVEKIESSATIDKVILELADQHKLKLERITCTGHSLGAALSTLGAYYFKVAADPKLRDLTVNCINFGSPYVGNPAFTDAFNSLVSKKFRFMNRSDPVTMVAFPLPPIFDYAHIDEPVLLCQPEQQAYGMPPGKNGCPPVGPCPPQFIGTLRATPPDDKPQNQKESFWGFQAQLRNRPTDLFWFDNADRDHGMQFYQQGMNAALAALGVPKVDGGARDPLPLDTSGRLLGEDGTWVEIDKNLP